MLTMRQWVSLYLCWWSSKLITSKLKPNQPETHTITCISCKIFFRLLYYHLMKPPLMWDKGICFLNYGITQVGGDFGRSPVQSPAQSRVNPVFRTCCSGLALSGSQVFLGQVLETSKKENSTTSCGNLLRCFTILTGWLEQPLFQFMTIVFLPLYTSIKSLSLPSLVGKDLVL